MTLDAWEAAQIGVKAIMYAATFGAAGGVFFLVHQGQEISDIARRRIRRFVGGFVCVAILVSAFRIAVLAGSAGGGVSSMADRTLLDMMIRGSEGQATGIRIIGLSLVSLITLGSRRMTALAAVGAILAATSFGWVGHARGANGAAVAMVLIAIHLLGIAFWLGAFMPLITVLRDPDPTHRAAVVGRFGRSAGMVVGLLVAAGFVLLWILLGTPLELWSSNYGRMFLVKIFLAIVLLGLAALNKWRWTPRLQNLQLHSTGLRGSIIAEMAVAMLILLTTASITTLLGPPTR